MSSRDVEYRLLQLVVSAVGDERITLALLHWDGRELRFAANATRASRSNAAVTPDVRRTIRALRSEAVANVGQGLLNLGVDLLHDVREGRGGLLAWGPIRRGRTASASRHFAELARELDLHVASAHGEELVPTRAPLTSELVLCGERLQATVAAPDRIRVRNVVTGLRAYESPLSWLNGAWHHSFPLSFYQADSDAILKRVQATLGRIDVSVPAQDVGVVVAAHPDAPEYAARLDDIARFVEEKQLGRVRLVRAPMAKTRVPSLDALSVQILADVGGSR